LETGNPKDSLTEEDAGEEDRHAIFEELRSSGAAAAAAIQAEAAVQDTIGTGNAERCPSLPEAVDGGISLTNVSGNMSPLPEQEPVNNEECLVSKSSTSSREEIPGHDLPSPLEVYSPQNRQTEREAHHKEAADATIADPCRSPELESTGDPGSCSTSTAGECTRQPTESIWFGRDAVSLAQAAPLDAGQEQVQIAASSTSTRTWSHLEHWDEVSACWTGVSRQLNVSGSLTLVPCDQQGGAMMSMQDCMADELLDYC
jgi:hypothetical protein